MTEFFFAYVTPGVHKVFFKKFPPIRFSRPAIANIFTNIYERCPWNFKSLEPPMLPPRYPWISLNNFSPFGPVIWPAIADKYIYMSKELYYIED